MAMMMSNVDVDDKHSTKRFITLHIIAAAVVVAVDVVDVGTSFTLVVGGRFPKEKLVF